LKNKIVKREIMFNKRYFPILIFSFIVLVLIPVLIFGDVVTIDSPLKVKTFEELLDRIIDFLFNLSIPLTTLMLLVAGFYYISAAGNPEQISTAHNIIKWTLIGFIIILCAKGMILFLEKKVFQI